MHDGFELLIDPPLHTRALKFMKALAESKPAGAVVTSSYGGEGRVLVLYGPGSPQRLPVIRAHLAKGGRVAMWDLGYWDREHGMRLSVDSMHPTADQLAMAPDGPGRREFTLRNDYDERGPILLVGLGAKSVYAYGLRSMEWERSRLKDLRTRFPGRPILWRPKGRKVFELPGTTLRHGMPIEQALRGCSLAVVQHSNVAVDACIAGIPVECADGAAKALYAGNSRPTEHDRAEFLRRLSWWEWGRADAPKAWDWIKRVTNESVKQ